MKTKKTEANTSTPGAVTCPRHSQIACSPPNRKYVSGELGELGEVVGRFISGAARKWTQQEEETRAGLGEKLETAGPCVTLTHI